MFTGIVRELGRIKGVESLGGAYRLSIESPSVFKDAGIGDSISVNGVCLTVARKKSDILYFDIMDETVRRTGLSFLKTGDPVNMENSLRAKDTLGGHFVLGHIDCLGTIKAVEEKGPNFSIEIEIPEEFTGLVVPKGSVAIEGVSLTVGETRENRFKSHLIPHTLKTTTLGRKKAGDRLNIEFDIIGKYILKSKEGRSPSAITEGFLREKGFF